MSYVAEKLIEATWRELAALTGKQLVKVQKAHRKAQRPLVTLVSNELLQLREDAAGVGLYVFHVVLEAFSRALPRPHRVRKSAMEEALAHGQSGVHPKDASEQSSEPHVLRYVYEALHDDLDDVVLSENESEQMFGILQAVTVCLHDACEGK